MESKVTYNDLAEANKCSVLLKGHTSINIKVINDIDTSDIWNIYCDADYYSEQGNNGNFVFTSDVQGLVENGVFSRIMNMRSKDFFENYKEYFLFKLIDTENIIGTVKQSDGTLLITTSLDDENADAFIKDLTGSVDKDDYIEYEYVVEEKDYRVKSIVTYLCHKGKDRKKLQHIEEIIYDEKAPDYIAETMKLADEALPMKGEEERKITVTLDPDTDKEETFSFTTKKGFDVLFATKDGYSTLYTDKACTQVYKIGSSDKNADLNLYSIPDAK